MRLEWIGLADFDLITTNKEALWNFDDRLPLHYICEMTPKEAFKFISPEFQLDSYKAWIEVAKTFKFSPDNIKLITVQNTMQVTTYPAPVVFTLWIQH